MVTKDEVLQELFETICFLSHKHEVQYWKDAPGTDAEKLAEVLQHARKGLALVKGKIQPEHV